MKHFFIQLSVSILLISTISSCIKKIDGPIEVNNASFEQVEIALKADYSSKSYYNLASNSIVKTSPTREWSIAFNNTGNGEKVILNYEFGFTCFGQTTNSIDFNEVVTESSLQSLPIQYSNHYDDFATLFSANFNGNTSKGYIYYLNFSEFGYKKLRIIDYQAGDHITIEYANLNNSDNHVKTIPLGGNTNFTYYSLFSHQTIDVEPADKSSWDLEFTRYTTLVTQFGDTRMYSVAGVLNNQSKNITVAEIENSDIENIDLNSSSNAIFDQDIQAIGYDWKIFSDNSNNGVYSIPSDVYIVNNQGRYYSMQFINFSKLINNETNNGYPKFLLNPLN